MTAFPPGSPEQLCKHVHYCWRAALIAGFVVFIIVLIIFAAHEGWVF